MSAIPETEFRTETSPERKPRFEVCFASTREEIQETQKLRYKIFSGELGAQLKSGDGDGLDYDQYDPFCRHLMVRETETGRVIACTRILTGDRASDAGGFYSESEFDLAMLDSLPGRFTVPELCEVGAEAARLPASRTHSLTRNTVSAGCRVMEIGRTCVDAEYRSGAVIALLWQGIAAYITSHNFDYLFGCASIGLEDGGAQAHAILSQIRDKHLAPERQRVRPYIPLPAADARTTEKVKMPPLLKAYLSLGAKACGEAYWDRDFNCADVFMLLNVADLNPRYARHFLGSATAPGVALPRASLPSKAEPAAEPALAFAA